MYVNITDNQVIYNITFDNKTKLNTTKSFVIIQSIINHKTGLIDLTHAFLTSCKEIAF